jgi:Tol biopolymer transport system component
VPVLDGVAFEPEEGSSQFSVSAAGTLVYLRQSILFPPRELTWVDRRGAEEPSGVDSRVSSNPRLSPNGRQLALAVFDDSDDIWVHELDRGTSTRLTFELTAEDNPVWTPDGRTVIYRKERPQYDLYWRPADGSRPQELLYTSPLDKMPRSVSPDGELLAFEQSDPETQNDIWLLSLEGKGEPTPLIRTPFDESNPEFSPDGRWLAFSSEESGRSEVYVLALRGGGGKLRVSIEGGSMPVWSRDGKELFYRNGRAMMAVAIDEDSRPGRPRLLFEGLYESTYDVAADGRFLMVKIPEERAPRQVEIVLNWFEELRRLAPTE